MRVLDQTQEFRREARAVLAKMRQRGELLYVAMNPFIRQCYPDFLCIGAPRTGTTWLFSTLKRHPDVFLPRKKELHFFDEPIMMTWQGIKQNVNVCAYGRYFDIDNPVDWRWYYLQFRSAGNRIKGDITPGYCRLSDKRVRLIAEYLPDARIIFVMREPVQRAWSGVRKFALSSMRKPLGKSTLDEIMEYTMQPHRLMAGDYREIINRWESYYNRGNILYLFYDDLVNDPFGQASKVCEFLGLDVNRIRNREAISKRVNVADQTHEIPETIKEALIDYYGGQAEFLEEKFDRDLSCWKVL